MFLQGVADCQIGRSFCLSFPHAFSGNLLQKSTGCPIKAFGMKTTLAF
jgi:hypothetical protein